MSDQTPTSVLGEEINTAVDNSTNQQENQNIADQATEVDYLANLVGEGKKYKSAAELAKAYANADQFIETLKTEKQALEAKTAEAKTVDDIIAKLKQEKPEETYQPPTSNDEVPKGLTVDQLEEWFAERQKKQIEEETAAKQVEQIKLNQEKAWNLLASEDAFGSVENAKRAIAEYIGQDQTKADVINRMGGYTPEDLVVFLKSTVKSNAVQYTDDSGVKNTQEDFTFKGKLTWDKVKEMEKENPKLKKDRKWNTYVNKNLEL